jgi:hypothetical protein
MTLPLIVLVTMLHTSMSTRSLTPWFDEHHLNVSAETFASVSTLLMFVGYPRSAHSLVGAILDAHPHMAVAHEFNLLSRFQRFASAFQLAEALFYNAERADLAEGGRMQSGYSYVIEGAWQGSFRPPLLAIGDKKGHGTTAFLQNDFDDAIDRMRRIQQFFRVDMRFLHVLRNPYDNIATMIFYEYFVNSSASWKQMRIDAQTTPIPWRKEFEVIVDRFVLIVKANERFEKFLNDCEASFESNCIPRARMIHIDGAELLAHPMESMKEWCTFLNVPFNQQWADASRKLLFSEPFPSRNMLVWPRAIVESVHSQLISFEPFRLLVEHKPEHLNDAE